MAEKNLEAYKRAIDKMGFNPSDRKKLLALPFYMAKRAELPEPKIGQPEFALFREVTGFDWNEDKSLIIDNEKKITEFDYENFIPSEVIKRVNTKSQEFKKEIRLLNLTSKTRYE